MFEISVTREFETWYQALEPEPAERVAAELNVLERLGPELDTTRASRLLLWFDGTQRPPSEPFGLRAAGSPLSQLLRRQHEALRCLETPDFLARFLKLEPRQAKLGHELVERVRASVRSATMQLVLLAPDWLKARAVSGSGREWRQAREIEAVQSALLDVLSFVGLKLEDVADRSSGLRELTVAELTPSCRLLYAIDAPRRRILAILGETLDRAYYGDSVRLAERRWRDYCRTLQVSPRAT